MLESGHTVFDCQIVKPLSENDVYQSYLVNCPDSTVAKLFLLLPEPQFDQKQRQSFFDHVGWLSSQTFPRIGSPLRAGEIEGQPACLYPLPQGKPLTQLFNDGFSVRQSVELVKRIAECLSVPHSAGLWHGNLSPETIYLDGDSPYLADFSLSQLIKQDYNSGINPLYTSPEQVRGETPGIAADIYNLGCVFYHLLVGQPPFSGGDAFTTAKQHLQGEFPSLPEELSILQPLLDSLTEAVAAKRSTIDELIDQITLLEADKEIDQICLSVTTVDSQSDASPSGEKTSLLDDTIDNSEVAARIEARLKEHAGEFLEPVPVENPAEEDDVTAELDKVGREGKIGFARFVLILLLGVVIGSGLYFLFYKQSPAVLPMVVEPSVVEPKVNTDNNLTAGLDQGLRLWQEADFNGAEIEFKRIISDYQEDPRAYNNLAAFYAAQGNYDQARDFLEQALAIDEKYATVYRNLGSVYAEMARGSYGRALQLDKAQALISLPVFSSLGVVNMKPATGDLAATQKPELKEAAKSPKQIEAGQSVAMATESINDSDAPPLIIVEQPEPLKAVVADESPQIEKEEPPVVVAKEEQLEASEPGDAITAVAEQESAEAFLQRWAQAWSDQDIDAYLTFYADQFNPPAGMARSDWKAQRRSRLARPKELMVSLESFKLILQEDDRLQIEVIQGYQSDFLTDRTRKIFDLQPDASSWKILRERSLGVIR
ncbi:MAG: tetratricopeptide repeat-containing serine/threonine-protein kinase [Desulfuromusa sp.]|jgi:serine/threonine protein kinase|nr:tetratricopeptide repeat-containing serine/threonine-protein kinase [Desulfuromusa sp.]